MGELEVRDRVTILEHEVDQLKRGEEKAEERREKTEELIIELIRTVENMSGQFEEMKRHNSKFVKVLVAIIGAMSTIIVALIHCMGGG